jgi:hypothetical protein
MFDAPDLSERSLTLVRKKIALTIGIPEEQIALSIDPAFQFITDTLTARLRTYLYGEQLPPHTETRTIYTPATWWEQLKYEKAGRWWMRRLVRRHPVRQKPITLTATWENMAAYPWMQLRTPVPEYLGAAVRLSLPPTSRVTGVGDGDDDD